MKSKQKLSGRLPEKSPLKRLEETRVMNKSNGAVKAYSANTYQGLVRNYNEDRVSIILNISKPDNQQHWPKCSYFGIFDGHGGSLCSDFLRDNLHKFVIEDKSFPFRPVEALRNGFYKAEEEFLKMAQDATPVEKSGSCALVALIIDDRCYVANVGDSRAILSKNKGSKAVAMSVDHKPNDEKERQRIQKAGGSVYQSNVTTKRGDVIPGPFRIVPGRLSVSRAIGDIQAKLQKYMGNPRVLIAEPEITQFTIDDTYDFIMLGCDGIFDKLTNEEINSIVWKTRRTQETENGFLKQSISRVIEESMAKKSLDNLTAVLILINNDDTAPKKSQSSTTIGYSNTLKQKTKWEEKLKTCTKQELLGLSRLEKEKDKVGGKTRRVSFDLNKQNTNNTNTLNNNNNTPSSYVSNLHNSNYSRKSYNLHPSQQSKQQQMQLPKLRSKYSELGQKRTEIPKHGLGGRKLHGQQLRY